MSLADPVGSARSGALDEEKADTMRDAEEGSRAEAGDDPDDLLAEEVPLYTTAGGVWEGLMALCLGYVFLCCRGAVTRQEDRICSFIGQGCMESSS